MSQPQLQTSFLKFGSQIQVKGFHKILLQFYSWTYVRWGTNWFNLFG